MAPIDIGKEYSSRLEERVAEELTAAERVVKVQGVAQSTERHFKALLRPRKRYQQARLYQDDLSAAFERRVLHILLYEIVDHSYMVLGLLDFDRLGLDSSTDGMGLAGESAAEVVNVLKLVDEQCARALTLEEDLNLKVDFAVALDEKEGITYVDHPHWQNFIPKSLDHSFYAYFGRAQQVVLARLAQQPRFWKQQTVGKYLRRRKYESLGAMIDRLRMVDFPQYPA